MFGIGVPEMLVILTIALVVIGPKKLPDLAKSIGRAMREFKKATNDLKSSVELEDLKSVKSAFGNMEEDVKNADEIGEKNDAKDIKKDGEKPEVKGSETDPKNEEN